MDPLLGPLQDNGGPTWTHALLPVYTAQAVLVRFAGSHGSTYSVQRAPSVTGPWNTLGTTSVGTDGMGTLQDTNPPAGRAYYRAVYP